MTTDDAAADLGTLRTRVDLAIAWLNGDLTYVPKDWTPSEAGPDVAAILAAYDAQAKRLALLEPCYADAQSTAACLLIEREQYDQTLRNAEERAQFAVERADVVEAERDQARVELDEHRIAYTALCGERDHEQVARKAAEAAMIRANMRAHAAEARATRLAALEEAARTVRESDPLLRGIEQPELRRHLFALYATVDALNASPGEGT